MVLQTVVKIAERGMKNVVKPEADFQRITHEESATVKAHRMLTTWTEDVKKKAAACFLSREIGHRSIWTRWTRRLRKAWRCYQETWRGVG